MGKFNPYLDVEASIKEVANGKLLSLFGIKSKDEINDIINRMYLPAQQGSVLRQPKPEKNFSKLWSKDGVVYVIIPKGKEDAFLDSGLKSIQSALIQSKKYNGDSILRLTDVVAQLFDTPSKEEMNKLYSDAAASEVEMWTDYINKMNDPNMVKVLELYSKIYGTTAYGHILSLKNAMTIRHLNNEATFVCGKTTWASWGYGIKRGAKKYPLWGGSMKNVKDITDDMLKKAMDELGHGLEEFGNLGVAVQQEVMIQASKDAANGKKIFVPYRYIGYDISDTYRFNPKEDDPLTSKPNIASNVIFALNALAQEAENKKKAERGEEIEGDDLMKSKTQKAIEVVQQMCSEKGIDCSNNLQNPEPSSVLVDCLIKLYSSMVEKKANVIKAGNIQSVAEDCTHLTLIMAGIGLDQLNRFRHPLQYTQKDMNALAPMMRYVIPQIGRAMVDENFDDDFMSKLKHAMKKIGMVVIDDSERQNTEMENIMESFKSFMKRLDEATISKPTRLE